MEMHLSMMGSSSFFSGTHDELMFCFVHASKLEKQETEDIMDMWHHSLRHELQLRSLNRVTSVHAGAETRRGEEGAQDAEHGQKNKQIKRERKSNLHARQWIDDAAAEKIVKYDQVCGQLAAVSTARLFSIDVHIEASGRFLGGWTASEPSPPGFHILFRCQNRWASSGVAGRGEVNKGDAGTSGSETDDFRWLRWEVKDHLMEKKREKRDQKLRARACPIHRKATCMMGCIGGQVVSHDMFVDGVSWLVRRGEQWAQWACRDSRRGLGGSRVRHGEYRQVQDHSGSNNRQLVHRAAAGLFVVPQVCGQVVGSHCRTIFHESPLEPVPTLGTRVGG
ncbi:hypothetical protein B0T10DRAFT_457650 [Thelonectria olida]|uniref:Uncharacterized protein n=1 Tax=Thelonectria olida TaxID=1576542 RepID=A0A9P9AT55_9HYPO|nr:hypothetical protein B0T10DRAFT_457650 [Thelonectria olida]